jgi:hypothetical protein
LDPCEIQLFFHVSFFMSLFSCLFFKPELFVVMLSCRLTFIKREREREREAGREREREIGRFDAGK